MSQPIPEPAYEGRFGFSFRSIVRRFVCDLTRMPRWHKGVLCGALVVCCLGWGHRIIRAWSDTAPSTGTQQTAPGQAAQPWDQASPPLSANTATASANNAPVTTIADSQAPDTPTRPAPWSRRVGGSVLLGFLIGWAFRTFVKTMALATTLIAALLATLSYFQVTNIDFTSIQKKYSDASGWVTTQADTLKDDALAHMHSGLGGALGLFIGARKRNY